MSSILPSEVIPSSTTYLGYHVCSKHNKKVISILIQFEISKTEIGQKR